MKRWMSLLEGLLRNQIGGFEVGWLTVGETRTAKVEAAIYSQNWMFGMIWFELEGFDTWLEVQSLRIASSWVPSPKLPSCLATMSPSLTLLPFSSTLSHSFCIQLHLSSLRCQPLLYATQNNPSWPVPASAHLVSEERTRDVDEFTSDDGDLLTRKDLLG